MTDFIRRREQDKQVRPAKRKWLWPGHFPEVTAGVQVADPATGAAQGLPDWLAKLDIKNPAMGDTVTKLGLLLGTWG